MFCGKIGSFASEVFALKLAVFSRYFCFSDSLCYFSFKTSKNYLKMRYKYKQNVFTTSQKQREQVTEIFFRLFKKK